MQAGAVLVGASKGLVVLEALEQVAVGHERAVGRALNLQDFHLNYLQRQPSSQLQNRDIRLIKDLQDYFTSFLMYSKTVLRKLGEQTVREYLVPREARIYLRYPGSCLKECSDDADWDDVVGIGAVTKQSRGHIIYVSELVVCNRSLEVIFKMARENEFDNKKEEEALLSVIRGKVVVGYDMGQLLTLLKIEHNNFIDLAYLHPQILPKRQSLRRIALQVLGVILSNKNKYRNEQTRRQYMLEDDSEGNQIRRRLERRVERGNDKACRYLVSTESANVCLKVAEKHIKEGRGIITTLPTSKKEFRDVDEILAEAEIDKNKVCGLFLRGSRALGIEVITEKYTSDWDYVCVLDTSATLNSILLKLHNVDLLVLDIKTFYIYVNGGDLPMIELFFLPPHCIYINRLELPIISVRNSKQSLVFHLKKCDQKLAHYASTFYKVFCPDRQYFERPGKGEVDDVRQKREGRRYQRRPREHQHLLQSMRYSSAGSKADPDYVKWKFIKVMHMQVRMLDIYQQIKENNRIINPLAKTELWKRLQTICEARGHFAAYQVCKDELNRLFCQVFTIQQLDYHNFHLQKRWAYENTRRRRRGRRYYGQREERGFRSRYSGRRRYPSRYYEGIQQAGYSLLSIYKASFNPSSDQMDISRVDDIEDDQSDFNLSFWQERSSFSSREPREILLNTITLSIMEYTNSPFLGLLNQNLNVPEKNFRYVFALMFIQPSSYFSIRYIKKCNSQLLEDDLSCLTNFIPQENANLELPVVQQASACILRSHLTELQHKISVKTLVCFMYKPFLEYISIKDNPQKVCAFEDRPFDVFEKRDGVLTALYYSGDGWVVGSKKTPDGREPISIGSSSTICDEFVRIFALLGYKMPQDHDKLKVFLFELLSTKIDNVIPKSKDELILHGVRNMRTLQEENPEQYAKNYGWQGIQKVALNTKSCAKIAQIVENQEGCQGFILRDQKFNRIVIRNSLILKERWNRQLVIMFNHPQYRYNKNTQSEACKKVYFIYSQIILKNLHQKYRELFPENQQVVNGILEYVEEVNRECLKLKKEFSCLSWEDSKINQLIADKRIDLLTYLHSYCYRKHPKLFEGRIQASVNFDKAFSFLMQHLYNRNIVRP